MSTKPGSRETYVSKAPTRVDLAGGTVDIWPIYLFLPGAITINLGIDLFAETTLEVAEVPAGRKGAVRLLSKDQGVELTFGWDELATQKAPPQLELHLKLLRHFAHARTRSGGEIDLTLSTRAKSPAGAGLGGSSTLSVSMIGALGSWAEGAPIDPQKVGEKFIEIVRDVETTVIQVPAGMQDYYGAMFGGLQCLKWLPGTNEREWLSPELLSGLESRLLLFYSGQSRNSGINNWALFKGFVDKDGEVRAKFEKIVAATRRLRAALEKRDWMEAGQAIAEEWKTRRTLAPGITTPEMDRAFAVAQKLFPGSSGKVCGAGGGGCFFIYLPEPPEASKKAALESELSALGVRPLPFRAVPKGVEITRA